MMTMGCFLHTRPSILRARAGAKPGANEKTNSVTQSGPALPGGPGAVQSIHDSERDLRLVRHAGGRFARRVAGYQLCAGPGGVPGNDPGPISRGILPAVYGVLRPPHSPYRFAPARGMVPQPLSPGAGLRVRPAACAALPGILP